jgi:DNA-binding response OmpR family regulator
MAETLLVVDDDPNVTLILRRKLSDRGYTVFTADNGQSGLSIAQDKKPDLIISDWMMPLMDGLELCRQIKGDEKLKQTYFILLTAKDSQDDKVEGIERGADDYLTKPFSDKELNARITAGLRITRLQNEIAQLQHERAIVELALTVGHEINNPLGIIMLMLQLLQRKADTVTLGTVRKELDSCIQSGHRISDIVKKLSSLESPQFKPYLKDSDAHMLDLSGGK